MKTTKAYFPWILALVFLLGTGCSQPEIVVDADRFLLFYGTNGSDRGMQVVAENNGGYLIFAESGTGNSHQSYAFQVDQNGRTSGIQPQNIGINTHLNDILQTVEGFTVTGWHLSEGTHQMYCAKLNAAGALTEEISLPVIDSNYAIASSLTLTSEGEYLFTGQITEKHTDNSRIPLLKTTASGHQIKFNRWGENVSKAFGKRIQVLDNGNYAILGTHQLSENVNAFRLIVTNTRGIPLIDHEYIFDAATIQAGQLYETATSYLITGIADSSIVAIEAEKSGIERSRDIIEISGQYATAFSDPSATGNTLVAVGSSDGIQVRHLSEEGRYSDPIWLIQKQSGTYQYHPHHIQQSASDGFLLCGTRQVGTYSEIFLLKSDAQGLVE